MLTPMRNPWTDLVLTHRLMDRLVERMLSGQAGTRLPEAKTWQTTTAYTLRDSGDAIELRFALPGFKSEDLDLSLQGDVLTVQAKSSEADGPNGGNYRRAIHLPAEVEAEAIDATYADDVLTVRAPKTAAAQPRRIPIGRPATGASAPAIEGEVMNSTEVASEPAAENAAGQSARATAKSGQKSRSGGQSKRSTGRKSTRSKKDSAA